MEDKDKETLRIGTGKAGPGRPKGLPNLATRTLKEAILAAAEAAGGKGGLVGYLTSVATEDPRAFCTLLGKVLPMQVTGEDGGPVPFIGEVRIVGVRPA